MASTGKWDGPTLPNDFVQAYGSKGRDREVPRLFGGDGCGDASIPVPHGQRGRNHGGRAGSPANLPQAPAPKWRLSASRQCNKRLRDLGGPPEGPGRLCVSGLR